MEPRAHQWAKKIERLFSDALASKNLLERAGSSFEAQQAVAHDTLRRLGANALEADATLSALKRVRSGSPVDPTDLSLLETIVEPYIRPIVDVESDSFGRMPSPFEHLNADRYRLPIERAIRATGRVDIPGHPTVLYAGTAFRVGENLMMTNRHVARLFANGVGIRNIILDKGLQPTVDLRQEVVATPSIKIEVRSVALIHPYFDCALLEVETPPSTVPILTLCANEPKQLVGRQVAIVGYPALDVRADIEAQNRIFRGRFDKKRLQPGEIDDYLSITSFGSRVDVITHDVSTLGGNSGSSIVDVETGHVIGLHFAGLASARQNYAIPSWDMAKDLRLVDLGVNFDRPLVFRIPPPWETKWRNEEIRVPSANYS